MYCDICEEPTNILFPIDVGYYTPIPRMVCENCRNIFRELEGEECQVNGLSVQMDNK